MYFKLAVEHSVVKKANRERYSCEAKKDICALLLHAKRNCYRKINTCVSKKLTLCLARFGYLCSKFCYSLLRKTIRHRQRELRRTYASLEEAVLHFLRLRQLHWMRGNSYRRRLCSHTHLLAIKLPQRRGDS